MGKKLGVRELQAFFDECGVGRTKHVVSRLLAGETVSVAEYPTNPSCKRPDHRSPQDFVRNIKRVLGIYGCIVIDGDTMSIPEKHKPTSYLK